MLPVKKHVYAVKQGNTGTSLASFLLVTVYPDNI